MNNIIFDYISVLPIFFFISLFYSYFVFNKKNDLVLFFWLFLAAILTEFIKIIPMPLELNWLVKRPNGASNIDLLSREGPTLSNGFPSGHMTVTTLYCVYIIMRNLHNNTKYQNRIILIHLILIILMGISRYFKKVHNIYQIIAGVILGYLLASIAFKINKKIDFI
jgi:membrane-associated phospholipid phosphatase